MRRHRSPGQGSLALVVGHVAAALASHEGHLALGRLGALAHDLADLLGHRRAANGAAVDRRFALDDGRRHRVAAGEAAGAAVVAGQSLAHGALPLIHFHLEFVAGEHKAHADHQADGGDDKRCNDDGCHVYPPSVRTTGRRSP